MCEVGCRMFVDLFLQGMSHCGNHLRGKFKVKIDELAAEVPHGAALKADLLRELVKELPYDWLEQLESSDKEDSQTEEFHFKYFLNLISHCDCCG